MSKVAEKALLDAFHIGFVSANDGLKTALDHPVEQTLIKLAQNTDPDKVRDRNIERLIPSSAFTDALLTHVMTFPGLSAL